MPLIQVRVIKDVFSKEQKRQIIGKLTDAMVSIEGESMRGVTWCVVEEVDSGDWGIGGKALTTRQTMFSVWLAYTIVWLAYGMRLVQGTLLQIGPELEEAARTTGATDLKVKRDVTLPLVRNGMLAAWLLIFLIFVREYSTGVYLLGPGTEVIGSLLVSLWGTGAVDLVSALSVVNVALIALGLAVALRLGIRLHA